MAKGDSSRSQNQINYQGGLAQNNLNNQYGRNLQLFGPAMNNYTQATQQQMPQYGNMMNAYQQFLGGGNPYQGQQSTQQGQQLPSATTQPFQGLTGDPNSQDTQKQFVADRIKATQGREATDSDYNYWLPKFQQAGGLGTGKYWYDRMTDPEGTGSNAGGGQGNNNSAISGWQNFAQTGGFTPQGIQDIRARMVAPTRAIYQNAQDELQRSKGLGGEYSPNFAPAQQSLARQANSAIGDQSTNANAAIAQMVQQGQLSGLQGLTGAQLGAMSGMSGLFGTAPGMSSVFGNQALGANQQNLSAQEMQNQLAGIIMNAQNQKAGIPGNYQQALGNIGGTLGLAGGIAGMFG